jgi:hypothetical protein
MTIEEEKTGDSRSDISAAFEAYETANEDEVTEAPEIEATPVTDEVPVEAAEAAEDTTPAKNEGTLSLPGKAAKEPAETPPQADETFKPPQSWTPAAREGWDKVPKPLQKQISDREGQMNAVLKERGELRGVNDNVGKLFEPFASMFQAQGLDPWRGTYNVLNTAAQLQGGTQAQKAQITLQLIKDFGVDIGLLDDLMVGKEGLPSHTDELADLRNQLAQTQQWQQQQQHQQQQHQQQAQDVTNVEVNAFVAANEFAQDLRLPMADFMDMAERGGEGKIGLDVAYQRAMAARPDLQALINNRNNTTSNTDALARANAASVSVPQTSGAGGAKIAPVSRREALLDAWDNG